MTFFSRRIRVSDMNYGNHLGIIEVQHILHDVRVAFFESKGVSEHNFGGENTRLVATETGVKLSNESSVGEILEIKLKIVDVRKVRFKIDCELFKVTTLGRVSIGMGWVRLALLKNDKLLELPRFDWLRDS